MKEEEPKELKSHFTVSRRQAVVRVISVIPEAAKLLRRTAIEIVQELDFGNKEYFGIGGFRTIVHEQECPVTGRYDEVEKETTVYGGGDIPMAHAGPMITLDRCLDCRAFGFRRFKLHFEDGREKRIERILKKRTL